MDPAWPPPFTTDERADLIHRILELDRRIVRARAAQAAWWDLASEHGALKEEYVRRVPRPVVSYDPIGDQPFRLGVDTFGLDGPWWDIDGPARPIDEPLPLTWYAANGAMRLQEPTEQWASPIRVGPVAPYVVPRVLDRPGVVAVVSTVPVGHHTGWLTVYFAPWPGQPSGRRMNEWSRRSYRVRTEVGPFGFDRAFDYEPEWDFDLARWITRAKLLWTPPDQPGAVARATLEDCPYLGLFRRGDPKGMGILSFGKLRYTKITKDLLRIGNPNID